jgi:hypothetical protein
MRDLLDHAENRWRLRQQAFIADAPHGPRIVCRCRSVLPISLPRRRTRICRCLPFARHLGSLGRVAPRATCPPSRDLFGQAEIAMPASVALIMLCGC